MIKRVQVSLNLTTYCELNNSMKFLKIDWAILYILELQQLKIT